MWTPSSACSQDWLQEPTERRISQCKNLILKSAHYQVRVQGHVQKRTEKAGVLEDVFHNHDSKSGMTRARTKGLKQVLEPAVHQSFILETLAAMLTVMCRFFPKSCSLVTIVEWGHLHFDLGKALLTQQQVLLDTLPSVWKSGERKQSYWRMNCYPWSLINRVGFQEKATC